MRRQLLRALIAIWPAAAAAQSVPPTIAYHGFVTNAAGDPADGDLDFDFALYAAATGGTALWSETTTLEVAEGKVSATLGATTPFPASLFDGSVYYLGVTLEGGDEMTPRIAVNTVPYAFLADTAAFAEDSATLEGLASTDFAGATHAHALDFASFGSCIPGSSIRGWDTDGTPFCEEDDTTETVGAGDITSVIASDGLFGGGLSGDVTLAVDFSTFGACTGTDKVYGIDPGTGAVQCATDTGAAYTASGGVEISGSDISLDSTGCAAGAVWKWDGAAWNCVADADTTYTGTAPIDVTGTVISLSTSGCTSGEIWKWSGSAWTCSADNDTNSGGTVTSVTGGSGISVSPSPLVSTGSISLSSTGCVADEAWRWNGTTWSCEPVVTTGTSPVVVTGNTVSLSTTGCAAGDIWKYDGAAWSCDPDAGAASGDITAVTTAVGSGLTGGGTSGDLALALDWTNLGTCIAGSSIRGWSAPGTPLCETDDTGVGGGTGDIDAVYAGLGLSGGAISGEATLAIDFATLSDCTGTDKVVGFNDVTGAVTCAPDVDSGGDITGVTAGSGLAGGGTGPGAVTLSIAANGVASTMIADNAVLNAKISDATLTFGKWASNSCVSGQIPKWNGTSWGCAADDSGGSGTVTSVSAGTPGALTGTSGLTFSPNPITGTGSISVASNGITSAMILDGAVTSTDIANGTVAFADWASNSCASGQIPKWNGTSWDCAADDSGAGGTVTSVASGAGLTGGPITTSGTLSVATNGITSGMILDDSIASTDIANDTITSADILNGSIYSTDINNGTILAADIDTTSVQARVTGTPCTAGDFVSAIAANGAATCGTPAGGGDITDVLTPAAGGLSGGASSGSVSLSVAANGVTSAMILDGTVASADILDSTITGADILNGTVVLGTDTSGTYDSTADTIADDGTITSAEITNGTIVAADTDTTSVQARVTGTPCAAGDFVSAIAANGAATCGTPAGGGDITGVSAGAGLSGGGLSGDVSLSIGTGSVTSAMILDNSVASVDIADNSVASADILDGTITGADILNGTVVLGTDTSGTYDATTDTIADDGTITLGTETTGTYDSTADTIADDGTIASAEITNGTIAFVDWSSNSCADTQIPKWNAAAAAWQCQADTGAVGTFLAKNATDTSSASVATAGGSLYAFTQTNTVAATGTRSVLTLTDNVTTPGAFDYLIRATNGAALRFEVNSGGEVAATTLGGGSLWTNTPEGLNLFHTGAPGGGGEVRFWEAGMFDYVGFKAPDASITTMWTLPGGDGASGNALTTDGFGTLYWSAPDSTADTIADDGTITLGTETTGTYDSTADTIVDDGAVAGGVGGEITDGTIVAADVDTSSVQARVTGTCAAGSFVTAVAATGTVSCSSDLAAGDTDYLARNAADTSSTSAAGYLYTFSNTNATGTGTLSVNNTSGPAANSDYSSLYVNMNKGDSVSDAFLQYAHGIYVNNTSASSVAGATTYAFGVRAYATGSGAGTNVNYGVFGSASGTTSNNRGLYGEAYGAATNYGVYGTAYSSGTTNYGVYGTATTPGTTNYGVYGTASGATTNWAGYFSGNVNVTGTVSAASFSNDAAAGRVAVTWSTTSTSNVALDSFTVNAPAAGTLFVEVAGRYWLNCDATGSSALMCWSYLGLCDTSASSAVCDGTWGEWYYEDPDATSGTNETPAFVLTRTVSVSGAGARVFYLNGYVGSAPAGTSFGSYAPTYATAIFVPDSMSVTNP